MGKDTTELLALLENNADAVKATAMSAYMKDLFSFHGINKPKRSALTKDYLKSSRWIATAWGLLCAASILKYGKR